MIPRRIGQHLSKKCVPLSSQFFSPIIRQHSSKTNVKIDIFNPTFEHQQIREMVRRFAEEELEPTALEDNRMEKFNMGHYKKCGELGLLGITVPAEYDGTEMDAVAAVIVHEELSAVDPAFCLSYLAHSMLFVNNLANNGSQEQCKRWLPGACSGELIGGMCMSEATCGTDVLGMRTKADREGDNYRLTGTKMWITNGAVSDTESGDIFLVYAKTGSGRADVSLFLVNKEVEGFSVGQRLRDKCGMRASGTAELLFDNCLIPSKNLVGEENGAVYCMMRNLEIERLTLAAMSLGIARRCVQVMIDYTNERKAFGKPINSFGQIQRQIGESYAEYMAGRSYVYNCAYNLDLEKGGQRTDSDGVKLFASTMAKHVADRAIQCLGGYGYMGEYAVERLWRDSKLLEIGGGTVESHHKNITNDLKGLQLH